MTEYRYQVPLPDERLSPNSGQAMKRWSLIKGRAEYLAECRTEIRLGDVPPTALDYARVEVVARVCRKRVKAFASPARSIGRYRPLDEPNLLYALKPMYDALVQCGVVADDTTRHMRCEMPRIQEVPEHTAEGVFVTVVEAVRP